MKTITTKYMSATNTLGSRIKATGGGQSVTVPYDYAMSDSELHAYAVTQLNKKLEWSGEMVGGSMPNGMVWVFVTDERITL
jgi:hypothetical protein